MPSPKLSIRDSGMEIELSALQFQKACLPIFFTLSGILIVVSREQKENADSNPVTEESKNNKINESKVNNNSNVKDSQSNLYAKKGIKLKKVKTKKSKKFLFKNITFFNFI